MSIFFGQVLQQVIMLTVILYLKELRYVIPAGVMLGVLPPFLAAWAGWKILSSFLPEKLYRIGVDSLSYNIRD